MVFVELPEVGVVLAKGQDCAVVESVKAASDIYAPLAGEVTAVNEAVSDSPELLNKEPYGEGWLFRMRPANAAELGNLFDAAGYASVVAEEEN
ncbi:MAG: glycine cleavage system H protein [Thiohalomonadaceae bacterium]